MPRHSAQQQPAWLRPRIVVTLAVATAGLATAIWLPTRNDTADASERNRSGWDRNRTSSSDRFSDNFRGDEGSTVDPGKWVLNTGRLDNGLTFRESTRNAQLDGDGNLVITAREGDRSGLTSARLVSRATFRHESGRVEARVRVPEGDGLRPVFALYGSGRPDSGTIDLLADPVTDDDFHTYEVSWTPESITLSVDGETVRKVAAPRTETAQPFRLVLTLVVTDADEADLPARMAVDSVKVESADAAEEPSTPPTPSSSASEDPAGPPSEDPTTPPSEDRTTPPAEESTSPPATTTPPTQAPTTPPTTAPAAKPWKAFTVYVKGDVVKFKGDRYQVLEAHTSLPGWEPTKLPNLFKKL
ncbi:family 16 glycosylhydrolase [Actinoplanes sp. NPDC051475]|uniref:carbohydrate-binding protein n=1 Tax=Actinoplanes sp. NPDC051475 TaxID=3157225 RepID=UPI00344DE240